MLDNRTNDLDARVHYAIKEHLRNRCDGSSTPPGVWYFEVDAMLYTADSNTVPSRVYTASIELGALRMLPTEEGARRTAAGQDQLVTCHEGCTFVTFLRWASS